MDFHIHTELHYQNMWVAANFLKQDVVGRTCGAYFPSYSSFYMIWLAGLQSNN
jgi:hypothetical protein